MTPMAGCQSLLTPIKSMGLAPSGTPVLIALTGLLLIIAGWVLHRRSRRPCRRRAKRSRADRRLTRSMNRLLGAPAEHEWADTPASPVLPLIPDAAPPGLTLTGLRIDPAAVHAVSSTNQLPSPARWGETEYVRMLPAGISKP